jgi:hypothetical protein
MHYIVRGGSSMEKVREMDKLGKRVINRTVRLLPFKCVQKRALAFSFFLRETEIE